MKKACVALIAAALLGVAQAGAVQAATLFDPVGDSLVANSVDILSLSGSYDENSLYLVGRFTAGSFSAGNIGILIGLDSDMNRSTGAGAIGRSFPVGAEYSLSFNSQRLTDPGKFSISHWDSPNTTSVTGFVVPSFDPNGFTLVVPLSLIGGNGLLNFGMGAGVPVSETTFVAYDFAGVARGESPILLNTPTTVIVAEVPEPGTYALLLGGLAAIGTRIRRMRQRRA